MSILSRTFDDEPSQAEAADSTRPVEHCWDGLHAFVRYRLRVRRDDADDIVQETFLRVLSARGESARMPAALLRGVARNVVRELWRQRRGLSLGELGGSGEDADCFRTAAAGPACDAESGEERRRVVCSLLGARAEHADALVSHFWRGHTVREIAADSGRTAEAIRSTLRRALTASRRSLQNPAHRVGPDDGRLHADAGAPAEERPSEAQPRPLPLPVSH